MKEQEKLKTQSGLTIMTDGWDDRRHRSLYGTLAAERGEYPTILSLDDLTGKRGDADTIVGVVESSMKKMMVEPEQVAAIVTDDPKVMRAVRRKLKEKWPWIIVRRILKGEDSALTVACAPPRVSRASCIS